MANFDASTPQLEAVKKWVDGFTSLDISKVDQLVSRNFKFQSFPKTVDLPEQTKGAHLQWFGGLFALITKLEVGIQLARQRPSARGTDTRPQPNIQEMIQAPGKVVIHVRPSIKPS
jgi:hypothetical protein